MREGTRHWALGDPESAFKARLSLGEGRATLGNGLATRVVDFARGSVSLRNEVTGRELLARPGLDVAFEVDGLVFELARDFRLLRASPATPRADFAWTPKRYATEINPWPPRGATLVLEYESAPTGGADGGPETGFGAGELGLRIELDLFDGLPAFRKRVELSNRSGRAVVVNRYVAESLAIPRGERDALYLETDYNGGCGLNNNRRLSIREDADEVATTFDMGPEARLEPGASFEGFRTFELLHSVEHWEWKMAEVKTMYRIVAPWTNESPLFLHLKDDRPNAVRRAIDDCAELGFDMVIQSFGSGVDMERAGGSYLERHRKLYDYAHSKGLDIGAYTLAIIRNYLPVLGPEATDGDGRKISRCLASQWSRGYWERIFRFIDRTGADFIEIDGPYHFYPCKGGRTHEHSGLSDSRWAQWQSSTVEMFRGMKRRGVFVNAPDWMFLCGNNKAGIGYEEIAFSRPREEQLALSRLYAYKGTFLKNPSMAWAFVPISVYHGGGRKACFAPLERNVRDYDWALAQAVASGVAPCFRGKRLCEGPRSRAAVRKWAGIWRKYHYVLNGTVVHFLPPRMDPARPSRTLDLDASLVVRSAGETRGFLMVFNQTDRAITKKLKLPLFWTGLSERGMPPAPKPGCALWEVPTPAFGKYPPPFPVMEGMDETGSWDPVSGYSGPSPIPRETIIEEEARPTRRRAILSREDREPVSHNLDSNGDLEAEFSLPAMSYAWFVIREDAGGEQGKDDEDTRGVE